VLFGGAGSDTYRFLDGAVGKTTIGDFQSGVDMLDLSMLGVTGLDGLTIRETRFGTKIEFGDLDIVLNITPDQLDADSFLFADPDTTTTIDFDDAGLAPPGAGSSPLDTGYLGLQWENFEVLDTDAQGATFISGYAAASGTQVALNGGGSPATLSSEDDFDFVSLTMAAAWRDGLLVDIEAYDDGVFLGEQRVTLDYGNPQVVDLDASIFASIDEVRFFSFGGVDNPFDSGTGRQIAFDDFVIA
jgi:hypothetical protein